MRRSFVNLKGSGARVWSLYSGRAYEVTGSSISVTSPGNALVFAIGAAFSDGNATTPALSIPVNLGIDGLSESDLDFHWEYINGAGNKAIAYFSAAEYVKDAKSVTINTPEGGTTEVMIVLIFTHGDHISKVASAKTIGTGTLPNDNPTPIANKFQFGVYCTRVDSNTSLYGNGEPITTLSGFGGGSYMITFTSGTGGSAVEPYSGYRVSQFNASTQGQVLRITGPVTGSSYFDFIVYDSTNLYQDRSDLKMVSLTNNGNGDALVAIII